MQRQLANREAAIQAYEAALEADTQRFDGFLKANDAAVQEAVRKAELESRVRQETKVERWRCRWQDQSASL